MNNGQRINKKYYKKILIKLREFLKRSKQTYVRMTQFRTKTTSKFTGYFYTTISILLTKPYTMLFCLFSEIKSLLKRNYYQSDNSIKFKTMKILRELAEDDYRYCFENDGSVCYRIYMVH